MYNPFEDITDRLNRIENCLHQLTQNSKDAVNPVDTIIWFDLPQLCHYLPDKPAKATVYGWISKSKIPHNKSEKKLRFLKSDIDAWLGQGRKKTLDEIAGDAYKFLKTK